MNRTTRRILIAGVGTAAVIGAAGTALAETGQSTTTGSATGSTGTHQSQSQSGHAGTKAKGVLRRVEHADLVLRGKHGRSITEVLYRGTVTAVDAKSITVTAADKSKQTYVVGSQTKVLHHTAATSGGQKSKPTASTISAVRTGDRVRVVGHKTAKAENGVAAGTVLAGRIIDAGPKKK